MDTNRELMRSAAEPHHSGLWPPELWIALSPDQTFDRLLSNTPASAARLLLRLSTILATIAIVVPITAVQRVTARLVITSAASMCFLVAIQMAAAAGVILSAPKRRVRLLQAFDIWFAGHLPYSLWMMTVAAIALNSRLVDMAFVFMTAMAPAAWTAWIVAAYCRRVLDVDRKGARRRAAAHQAVVWAIALTYAALMSGGWSQVVNAARLVR